MKLTGKDRVFLRGLGHGIKPIIQIGKGGLSDEFTQNIMDCFESHELIKVKVLEKAPKDKKALATEIEKAAGCAVAQIIGNTLLLYRPFKEEPGIKLPG